MLFLLAKLTNLPKIVMRVADFCYVAVQKPFAQSVKFRP